MDAKEIRNLCLDYFGASAAYRAAMEQVLDATLKEGDYIDFAENEIYVCVAYDGGNHPEYASTLDSQCYGVGKKDGHIYFNLEDCNDYHFLRMFTIDLSAIFDEAGHLFGLE